MRSDGYERLPNVVHMPKYDAYVTCLLQEGLSTSLFTQRAFKLHSRVYSSAFQPRVCVCVTKPQGDAIKRSLELQVTNFEFLYWWCSVVNPVIPRRSYLKLEWFPVTSCDPVSTVALLILEEICFIGFVYTVTYSAENSRHSDGTPTRVVAFF